jgi:DNA-binding MarR family transcriptional regulator
LVEADNSQHLTTTLDLSMLMASGTRRHKTCCGLPSFTCIRIDCVLSLEDNILTALRRISQAIDVWSRELWHEFGLTAPQLATLREIIAGDNATPVTLASALHLSQPTVTGILHRLEQQGLIKRKRSTADRRSVLAVVTSRGRKLAEQAPPLLRDRFRQELGNISRRQQSDILSVLQHVAAMMSAPEAGDALFLFLGKNESAAEFHRGERHRRRKSMSNNVRPAR